MNHRPIDPAKTSSRQLWKPGRDAHSAANRRSDSPKKSPAKPRGDESYENFLRRIARMLEQRGYRNVALAGRVRARGHNQAGGYDLVASLPPGEDGRRRRVIVQVKRFGRTSPTGRNRPVPIYQRHVDELRGVVLRTGADEALLVTTGPVSPSLSPHSLGTEPAPVRVLALPDPTLQTDFDSAVPNSTDPHAIRWTVTIDLEAVNDAA